MKKSSVKAEEYFDEKTDTAYGLPPPSLSKLSEKERRKR